MPCLTSMNAYGPDLSSIHEAGFSGLAINAAAELLSILPPAGKSKVVVDLGCGGGTLAGQLSMAGCQVFGYDLSPAMVAIATKRVPKATFSVKSYVDADIPNADAVAAIGEVLNYRFDGRTTCEARCDLFHRIYHALSPGGLLLFDIATPERANAQPEQSFRLQDDWAVLVRTLCQDQILTREITAFQRDGDRYRRSQETHRLELLDPAQIEEELTSIGYSVSRGTTYGGEEVLPGLCVFHARKP